MKNSGNAFIPSFVFSNILLAIIAPYLVILIRELGYNPFWVGLLLSIFEGAGIVGPFILGYLADKTGNYRLSLIVACILPAVVVFPLIMWIHPLLSAVFLFFIAFGLRSLVSLIDAITTVQIGPSGNYGKIRAWGSIAFIFVTMFFQWTPFLKPENSFNISLWIFITALLCLIPTLILPKTLLIAHHHKDKNIKEEEKIIAHNKFYIFTGFSIIFLSRFALAGLISYFSLYMIEIINWNAVGLLWALAAIAEVPFVFISKTLIRRFNSMTLMGVSAFGVALRLLILAFLPFRSWIVISCLFHSICFGIYHPAAIDFVTSLFPVKKRGTGMSIYMIIGTGLPAITGALAGGWIIQSFGYRELFVSYAGVSGIAVLIYFVYLLTQRHRALR